MNDQATELRKLVLRAMRESHPAAGPAPRRIVVHGGKCGVGVTTLAVNLAVSLADQGQRIVLIDADGERPAIAPLCGLESPLTVNDVLVAGRDFHEVLQLGPAGIQVIPGLVRPEQSPDFTTMALERFMRQLGHLGRHADCVIVDAGAGSSDLVRRIIHNADDVIVVCTAEPTAMLDAYARIKWNGASTNPDTLSLIVNRSLDPEQSADVFARMNRSCQRFLGHGLELLGSIPEDPNVPWAARQPAPFVQVCPHAPAAQAAQQIAARLVIRGRYEDRPRAAA